MNRFQNFLTKTENKHIIWEIIKQFHPFMEENYISPYSGKKVEVFNKIRVYRKYDWVCIKCNGASIGIDLPVSFWGTGWVLGDFEKERQKNEFRSWRFSDDKMYEKHGENEEKYIRKKVHELLTKRNVPKPTAEEMYNYYYED